SSTATSAGFVTVKPANRLVSMRHLLRTETKTTIPTLKLGSLRSLCNSCNLVTPVTMIPASFDYFRPRTLDDALAALVSSEDAKVLAGGHSLIPAMKLRLAQPKTIIDISRIADMGYIREADDQIAVG